VDWKIRIAGNNLAPPVYERRCGLPARNAAVTGLSLLATNRTFHFGLKQAAQSLAGSQAWPMPVRSFTLVTIANEKSCRALFSDEITLTAIGKIPATLLRLY
jgi:hypothetical protein